MRTHRHRAALAIQRCWQRYFQHVLHRRAAALASTPSDQMSASPSPQLLSAHASNKDCNISAIKPQASPIGPPSACFSPDDVFYSPLPFLDVQSPAASSPMLRALLSPVPDAARSPARPHSPVSMVRAACYGVGGTYALNLAGGPSPASSPRPASPLRAPASPTPSSPWAATAHISPARDARAPRPRARSTLASAAPIAMPPTRPLLLTRRQDCISLRRVEFVSCSLSTLPHMTGTQAARF